MSSTTNGAPPADARGAALYYQARGFAPLPLPPRKKRPALDGWTSFRLTPDRLDEHFPDGREANVGLLLGEPSGGLVDVDLDCPEAVAAAPHLLPPTGMVTGRESAPASHWWYVADRPPDKAADRFIDPAAGPDDGLLAELRSTGGQTVAPPSVYPADPEKGHPRAERCVWHRHGDPARVTAAALRSAVGAVAAAALLGRHWPKSRRNACALAISGGLLRAGWTAERVENFLRAVVAANGNDAELDNRVAAVSHTAGAFRNGESVTGWPTLAKLLGESGEAIVRQVRDWLGVVAASGPQAVPGSGGRQSAAGPRYVPLPPFQPFPTDALPVPWAAFVREGARSVGCDESYLAVPVLAVLASAIGNTRRVYLGRNWSEPAVVFGCIIGESSTLKSPALALATEPTRERQHQLIEQYEDARREYEDDLAQWTENMKAHRRKEGGDPGPKPEEPTRKRLYCSDVTIERLADLLHENPRGLLVVRDELAGWLGSFTRYKSGGGSDLPNWLEVHRAGPITVDRKTGDRKFTHVPRAAVSVVGGIQPGILARLLTPEFMASGLTARLLLVMPPPRPKVWTEVEVSEDTLRKIGDSLDALYALDFVPGDDNKLRPFAVKVSPDAKQVWVEFYNAWGLRQAAAEGELAAAFGKMEGYAARFALIHHVVSHLAAGVDDKVPMCRRSVEAGVRLAAWFARETERVYQMLGETAEEKEVRGLVEQVRRRGGRITARQLHRSNGRKYRDSAAAEVALTKLVGLDLGRWEEAPGGPSGGRPTKTFVLHPTPDETDETPDPDDPDPDGGPPDETPDRPTEPPPGSPDGLGGSPTNAEDYGDVPPRSGEVSSVSSGVGRGGGEQSTASEPSDGAAAGFVGPGEVSSGGPGCGYSLVTDPGGLARVMAAVGEHVGAVGLDTETTGLDPRTDRLRLLQVAVGAEAFLIDLFAFPDPAAALAGLFAALSRAEVVGHNLQFDLRFLAPLGFAPGLAFCTMLASQVLHAGRREANGARFDHGLAAVARRELGRELSKDHQKSDWSKALTPEQLRYAADDAAVLPALAADLVKKIADADLLPTMLLEMRALLGVAWAAPVSVSPGRWVGLAEAAEAEQRRLAEEMDALAPNPGTLTSSRNWNSTADVAAAFAEVGVAVESTDDDALAVIDHPLAAKLRGYRAAAKRAGTYGKAWVEKHAPDGAILPSWRQIGAGASGRMSCADPNLQQIPRAADYRRCFAARPGFVLVKADYSQIELRIAAKVAGEEAMAAAYREGKDLHVLTAAAVLGKPADGVTKADRQLAKAVNFGLLYGMGAPAFRVYARSNYGVELTEEQARAYRNKFFSRYPRLRAWHRKVGADERPIDTRTLGGRRRIGVARFTEKLNTPVQGTGADGLKAAIALLWERRAECPGAVPVIFCHDEIVVEAAEADADRAAAWLRQAMVDGMAPLIDPVPVEVEVTVGRTWGGE